MRKDDIKLDILKEMFNIGVGKSASLLSEIVNKKILLSVPNLELIACRDDKENYFPSTLPKGTLVVSSITFQDKLAGEANLIFPADKMRQFINLCQNEKYEGTECNLNFTDVDLDIIKEVGNIILNSIIGEMGNFFGIRLSYSLPRINLYGEQVFVDNLKKKKFAYRLILYITFVIDGTEITGAVVIDLSLNSLHELIGIIEKMEDDLHE